ncbi:MAG: hypothetical protein J4F34_07770 [Gemmatimonadetes bacterium]|nr:hypothetical protein [Gemmatimonadota bacterium]
MKKLIVLTAFLVLTGCGEPPNGPPEAEGEIPDQELFLMDTVEVTGLSAYFDDPDDDPLSYSASSADATVVTAVAGENDALTLTATGQGGTKVTVTATDPDGEAATQTFDVMVPNRAPETVGSIPEQILLYVGDTTGQPGIDQLFTDPDGDELTYSGESSDESVATIEVIGTIVVVAGIGQGEATLMLTATDPGGQSASHEAQITVPNRAPQATAEIPAQTVGEGEGAEITLTDHFEDLDGDPLTFGAETEDPELVETEVAGSVLRITGLSSGLAQVVAIATDEYGESVSQRFPVTVTGDTGLTFRDDFDDLEAWADSSGDRGTAQVEDGDLHLIIDKQPEDDELWSYILHGLPGEDGHDGDWEIEYPVSEREKNATAVVEFWVAVDRGGVSVFAFGLDYSLPNWQASWMDEDGEWFPIADGTEEEWSDDSMIDYDGVTDIVFGLEDNVVYARGNDGVEIFSVDMSGELPGGADPPHHAKAIAYFWYSYKAEEDVEFGTDGAVIDSVSFTYAK